MEGPARREAEAIRWLLLFVGVCIHTTPPLQVTPMGRPGAIASSSASTHSRSTSGWS